MNQGALVCPDRIAQNSQIILTNCRCADLEGNCEGAAVFPPEGGELEVRPTGRAGVARRMYRGRGPDAVFAWSPKESGRWTIKTCSPAKDTVFYVRDGECASRVSERACDDDSPGGGFSSSRVEITAKAGRLYFIFADTYAHGSATSPFLLQVTRQAGYGSAAAEVSAETMDAARLSGGKGSGVGRGQS